MDETMMHCVDNLETQSYDVLLELNFSGNSDDMYAGINLRPGLVEMLRKVHSSF